MMKHIRTLLLAVLAGSAIAIGGAVFLSVENKPLGALLFTVGLYVICVHGLNLFTGKIGYLADQTKESLPGYLIFLLEVWLGNFGGTALSALCFANTRVGGALAEKAAALCNAKLADGWGSLFLLGVFCGLLMYAAVDGYKRAGNPALLFLCVGGFILCGFEHCIADMFYYAMAGFPQGCLATLLPITLGNSLGGMLIPLVRRLPAENG